MPFNRETLVQLEEKFKALTVAEKYKFSSGLLEELYEIVLPPSKKKVPVRAVQPRFISINGTIVIDISVILRRGSEGESGMLVIDDVLVTPGTTGPGVGRIISGFGGQTKFYGFGSGIEREAFMRFIEEQEKIGEADLLDGESRSKIYFFLPDPEKPSQPLSQVALQTPRQPLTDTTGAELIKYLETRLPKAVQTNEFAIVAGQVLHNVPIRVIHKLIKILKEKGYQVLVDYRPELDPAVMKAALQASPAIIKANLDEFSRVSRVQISELKDEHNQPDFKRIATETVALAQKHNIPIMIVSLAKHGAIVAYQKNQKKYETFHVKAATIYGGGANFAWAMP